MKIKLNKYIIFYIILILISIIFYVNFNFFKSFFSNYQDYIKFSKLKSQNTIPFSNYKYNTKFLNIDIANLKLLNKDFSWAKNMLYKTNEYSYKKLYNLWNIYLLQAYNNFSKNKTWYINLTKQASAFYETSLENIPSYKNKKQILSNLNIAWNFLNFLYVHTCDNLFVNMIKKVIKINKLIPDIINVLENQETTLNKRLKYDDLKICINSFKKDVNKNISTLYDTKDFFDKANNWLKISLKSFQWNEVVCYQQSPAIKSKYKESISSSYEYYTKFLKKQKDLLKIFDKANKKQIKLLCDNKNKLADKQNKENTKMNKNFNNLKDLAQKSEHKRQQSEQKQEEQGRIKEQNKKDTKKNEQKNKEENKKYSNKVQSLEKQNKDIIEQIQKIKTQDNYNPLKYIQDLFKEFYANDKDFKDGKKQNSVWK